MEIRIHPNLNKKAFQSFYKIISIKDKTKKEDASF